MADDEGMKSHIQNMMKDLAEAMERQINDAVIFSNPADRLRESAPPSVRVIESNQVPQGKAYAVPISKPKLEIKFEPTFPTFDQSFIWRRIASSFAVPSAYFERDARPQPYRWQRRPGESLIAWGARLQERGLLDDPAIRWEYQRATLARPLEIVQAFTVTVRERVYNVYKIAFGGE